MYRSFVVSNFRCFQELRVAELERVNLFAGVNNVGKTALLEALFLHCGAYNPELALRLNAFRGIESVRLELGQWAESPWDSLFNRFDIGKTVEMRSETEASAHRVLQLKVIRHPEELEQIGQLSQRIQKHSQADSLSVEAAQVLSLEYDEDGRHGKYLLIVDQKGVRTEPIPPAPPFPAFFNGALSRPPSQEQAERFGKLQVRGDGDVVLETLKIIEPRLRGLTMVVIGGVPVLHGDIGGNRLIPLPLMGGGIVRLAGLATDIGNAANGIALIDEIENGLHHSVLAKVWQAVGEVARRFNTQVFATTHSWECIVAAHKAFKRNATYDFRLHRLELVKGGIRVVTYSQEALEAAIETGLEVR